MNIGALDTRARIERKNVTQDATYGTEVVTWTSVAEVWCSIKDALPANAETIEHGMALAKHSATIRMRYRSDIDTTMRIVVERDTPVTYQIVAGPKELGRRDGIEIMVEIHS